MEKQGCKMPICKKSDMRQIDSDWAESCHEIGIKYFRKFFRRFPMPTEKWAVFYCLEVYYFEFDRWADGFGSYNAMTKRNKPKHIRWVNRQLVKRHNLSEIY